MSQHFKHSGSMLPITLTLEETEIAVPCPTCAKLEFEGTIRLTAAADRQSGSTPAKCDRGHMTFISWSRETPAD